MPDTTDDLNFEAPVRVRSRKTTVADEPAAPAAPAAPDTPAKEPTYKVVAEVVAEYATLDEAMAAYTKQFGGTGDDNHTVKVLDAGGALVAGPSGWSYFTDEKGSRQVKTLSRAE